MSTFRNTIDATKRFSIEHRRPGTKGWTALGHVGTLDQARAWLIRFSDGGDFRIRAPKVEVRHG